LTEDVRDGALLHVRPPEVPPNRRAEPLHVLPGDRPVEAELGADLSDLPLLDHARLAAGLVDEDLGDVARHEPQQHEDQDRGAEERRDEKEQPSGYVAQSVLSSSRMSAWVTGDPARPLRLRATAQGGPATGEAGSEAPAQDRARRGRHHGPRDRRSPRSRPTTGR